MQEYTYRLFRGRWDISITIFGQILDKNVFHGDCKKVCDGIWLSFSEHPLDRAEIFCERDRISIYEGVNMVKGSILCNSPFADRTVIEIWSLQYNECYFQQEAMVIAMMHWCSSVFGFEYKEVESSFDRENNKYKFVVDGKCLISEKSRSI